jgi:hypothetical protein
VKKQFQKNNIIRISNAPSAFDPEWVKNTKLSKGNELRTEIPVYVRITPISAGPAKSKGNGRASPITVLH